MKETEYIITDDPNLEFKDISDEEYRYYEFEVGKRILLQEPLALNVSASGGHRVLTADGRSHYIPSGWIHIEWKNKEGAVRFNF